MIDRARAAAVDLTQVDPESPEATTAMTSYFAELDERFEAGFDPGRTDHDELRPPRGGFVVALSDGAPVAGGGVRGYETFAEVKRMWVHPQWRGVGLGSRLLRRLEERAAALGHQIVRLDTRHVLHEAIALYERAGYRAIERYNDNPYATHFFEKRLPHP